jgi:hypothetical protein
MLNGWYRVSKTFTSTVTGTGYFSVFTVKNGFSTYTGDGTSGIYIYGAQLEVGSVATPYIPSTETFTGRAGTATFIGSDGLIQTAASGVERLQYNPMDLSIKPFKLYEEQRTNSLVVSQTFGDVAWSKTGSTVTENSTTAPDGTTTADTLTNTSGSISLITQVAAIAASSTNRYFASCYVKAGTVGEVTLNIIYSGEAETNVKFRLRTKTAENLPAGSSYIFEELPNGWFRIGYLSQTNISGTATTIVYRIWGGSRGFGVIGETVHIWGAQLEAGSYPTSYIPTTTAAVTRIADSYTSAQSTRNADVAYIDGAKFKEFYNQNEGTVVVDYVKDSLGTSVYEGVYCLWEKTSPSRNIQRIVPVSTKDSIFEVNIDGVLDTSIRTTNGNSEVKATDSYKVNNTKASVNSSTVTTDTSARLPTPTALQIGYRVNGITALAGSIKRLTYYPKQLSDTQLQLLSGE